jgi:FtsH-binding integral membrane protein
MNLETWIRPNFAFLVPLLILLGLILKYRTKLTNSIIPVILYIVAFFLAMIWGFCTSQYEHAALWFDAIIRAGVVQGFVVTALAVMTYSAYHDTGKVVKKFKDEKEKIKKEKADG